MRRRVLLSLPILVAAVVACGGGSSSPAAPTQASPSQAAVTFTLGSASLKLSYTRPQ